MAVPCKWLPTRTPHATVDVVLSNLSMNPGVAQVHLVDGRNWVHVQQVMSSCPYLTIDGSDAPTVDARIPWIKPLYPTKGPALGFSYSYLLALGLSSSAADSVYIP